MLEKHLYVGDDGNVHDLIVNKMFADLYADTHNEDQITLENFNIYVGVIYGVTDFPITDFGDVKRLRKLFTRLFGNERIKIKRTKNGVRYTISLSHWPSNPQKVFVASYNKAIAIALSIVQDMRYETDSRLRPTSGGLLH